MVLGENSKTPRPLVSARIPKNFVYVPPNLKLWRPLVLVQLSYTEKLVSCSTNGKPKSPMLKVPTGPSMFNVGKPVVLNRPG